MRIQYFMFFQSKLILVRLLLCFLCGFHSVTVVKDIWNSAVIYFCWSNFSVCVTFCLCLIVTVAKIKKMFIYQTFYCFSIAIWHFGITLSDFTTILLLLVVQWHWPRLWSNLKLVNSCLNIMLKKAKKFKFVALVCYISLNPPAEFKNV